MQSVPVPQKQPKHILIVEDNVLQRFALAEWLRSQGYTVYEATCTEEAGTLLASPLIKIDLMITDIWLPGMIDGLDLVDYVKRIFPEMPVIVVSGMYEPKEQDKISNFFRKPYKLADISSRIAELLAHEAGK